MKNSNTSQKRNGAKTGKPRHRSPENGEAIMKALADFCEGTSEIWNEINEHLTRKRKERERRNARRYATTN
jgi:putative protein kinase ArgK-like GTPase of G3E family